MTCDLWDCLDCKFYRKFDIFLEQQQLKNMFCLKLKRQEMYFSLHLVEYSKYLISGSLGEKIKVDKYQ